MKKGIIINRIVLYQVNDDVEEASTTKMISFMSSINNKVVQAVQKSGSKSELVMAISVVTAIGVALYGIIGYCSRCNRCKKWFCIQEKTRKLVSEKNKFRSSERDDPDFDREEQRPGSLRHPERSYMIERTYEVTKQCSKCKYSWAETEVETV